MRDYQALMVATALLMAAPAQATPLEDAVKQDVLYFANLAKRCGQSAAIDRVNYYTLWTDSGRPLVQYIDESDWREKKAPAFSDGEWGVGDGVYFLDPACEEHSTDGSVHINRNGKFIYIGNGA